MHPGRPDARGSSVDEAVTDEPERYFGDDPRRYLGQEESGGEPLPQEETPPLEPERYIMSTWGNPGTSHDEMTIGPMRPSTPEQIAAA